MRTILYFFLLLFFIPQFIFANGDTTNIPVSRQGFHDKIKAEQKRADKEDGKLDGLLKVSNNAEVNLQVTDAIIRKINVLRNDIEINKELATNNDKVRYLRYVESLVRNFITNWKSHQILPSMAPLLVENFTEILQANIKGEDMAPLIKEAPYEVGVINAKIFEDNIGYKESKVILFRKFCVLHPDEILKNIGPFVDEPFADSLVIAAFNNSPTQLYSYAQSSNSSQGKLIRKIDDSRIKTVVQLSTQNRALFYFPFLDDLISGKQTIAGITKVVGTSDKNYDSVGYYRLLVKTEIDYYSRFVKGDTPIAMLGSNGLVDMLQKKAIQHFINPINTLHESPNPIRFRALEPLNAQELYYMMVLGENDIYTSSYKYSFDRMIQKMGPVPHGDSLLLSVN
ncbi:MAG TPA: hypothetical protein VJ279_03470, partial [Hanamia sp.]|nr:hypothetical protein [Hanamia sp.]